MSQEIHCFHEQFLRESVTDVFFARDLIQSSNAIFLASFKKNKTDVCRVYWCWDSLVRWAMLACLWTESFSPPKWFVSDISFPINDLCMMRVWQIVIRSVSGSKISYAKLELFLLVARKFTRNLLWLSTRIKWGKRNTCVAKEALAVWLTGKQPTRFLWIPRAP